MQKRYNIKLYIFTFIMLIIATLLFFIEYIWLMRVM